MKKLLIALMMGAVLLTNTVSASAAGVKDVFDAKYYAGQYKDLQVAFGDDEEALYQHFMEYGLKEGRIMNPVLDIANYRKQYEDLDIAFGDDWDAYVDHYFTYGIRENRDNGTDFDIKKYQTAYEDIQESFGQDYEKVARHFIEFGQNENRIKGNKSYVEPKPVMKRDEAASQEESTETVVQKENKTDAEDTNNTAKVPLVITAGFNENFEINVGEKLYIGREDICIELEGCAESEYLIDYYYTLYIKGVPYYGDFVLWYDGAVSKYQEVFTTHRVKFVEDNGSKGATLQITDAIEMKKPFELSGNEEDEVVTTEPEYMVGDNFVLFVDEGVKLYGNTMEWLDTVLGLAEKETGMTMPTGEGLFTSDPGWLFGYEVFAGVEQKKDKLHIYVVNPEKSTPCGGADYIILNPIDLESKQGEGWAILHEYTHALQARNGGWLSRILDEGWATYICGEICRKDEVIVFDFNADYNYSYYPKEITRENAEEIFVTEPEDGWDDYLYGYRLMHFLMEKYGKQVYYDMLADAASNRPSETDTLTREEGAACLKKHTSEDVFELFADWLEENKERFNVEY